MYAKTMGEVYVACLEIIGPHVLEGICPNSEVDQAKMAVTILMVGQS